MIALQGIPAVLVGTPSIKGTQIPVELLVDVRRTAGQLTRYWNPIPESAGDMLVAISLVTEVVLRGGVRCEPERGSMKPRWLLQGTAHDRDWLRR